MCELYGCIYNEDGECCYADATLKVESAKACNEHDYDNRCERQVIPNASMLHLRR